MTGFRRPKSPKLLGASGLQAALTSGGLLKQKNTRAVKLRKTRCIFNENDNYNYVINENYYDYLVINYQYYHKDMIMTIVAIIK